MHHPSARAFSAHLSFCTRPTPRYANRRCPSPFGWDTGEVSLVNSCAGTGFRSLRALQRWSRDRSRRSKKPALRMVLMGSPSTVQ